MTEIDEFIIPKYKRDAKKENYYYIISAANGVNGVYCVYADRLPDLLTGLLGTNYCVGTCKVGGGPSPQHDAHLYYAINERRGAESFFKGYTTGPVVQREGVLVVDKCISAEEFHQLVALNYTENHEFNHVADFVPDEKDDFTPRG